jgi:hypothetical protein
MKRNLEELIEEISDFLVIYLKSGKIGVNSFIKKTQMNISQLEQFIQVHFLLKEEVKQFVRTLPTFIRRFKTSTTVVLETFQGEVRGQIHWPNTIKERLKQNVRDRTIYTCGEKNRYYHIKENIVLKEFIHVLYQLLFHTLPTSTYEKYEWFSEWRQLKQIIEHIYLKNVYLSRIPLDKVNVTNRMLMEVSHHRFPLYRNAASLLLQYRELMSVKLKEEELKKLLKETFIYPEKDEVLFELYWVIQLIKNNTENAELQMIDGSQNLVAKWMDDRFSYYLYHDSTGSNNLKFHVSKEEVKETYHPYIKRKVEAMDEVDQIVKESFSVTYDKHSFWSGRPDILLEVYDLRTNKLVKVIIGEVKHTTNVTYAISGLKELLDYMKLVKDNSNQYLDMNSLVQVKGILFVDNLSFNQPTHPDVLLINHENQQDLKLVQKEKIVLENTYVPF